MSTYRFSAAGHRTSAHSCLLRQKLDGVRDIPVEVAIHEAGVLVLLANMELLVLLELLVVGVASLAELLVLPQQPLHLLLHHLRLAGLLGSEDVAGHRGLLLHVFLRRHGDPDEGFVVRLELGDSLLVPLLHLSRLDRRVPA